MAEIENGDWVQVWGQVQKADGPESMLIRFESKGEHYDGWITDKHITKPEEPPAFAEQCTHLIGDRKGRLRRCDLHYDHGGMHQAHRPGGSLAVEWANSKSYGYVEEK